MENECTTEHWRTSASNCFEERPYGWVIVLTIGAAFGGIAWGSLSKRIGFIGVFVLSIGLIALRWQSELWRLYLLYFAIGAFGFACARKRLAESGIKNCDFVAGDAYEVARLSPEPADFVFMANAFHGVPDKPRLFRAVKDVLKPGGRFAIINWHQRPRAETMILGEPRGPRTDLRLSPEQTIARLE
jgi:SAM-dependent methyltransferase